MKEHHYQLEKYTSRSSRFDCPQCGGKKTFSRYIDTHTGQYVNHKSGRCNREGKCGYHYPPHAYFRDNDIQMDRHIPVKPTEKVNLLKQISFIEDELAEKTFKFYHKNNFVQFLISIFGKEKAMKAVEQYLIGTSKKWEGATVFWQKDSLHRFRTGKIMQYNPLTGKRIKEYGSNVSWVHKTCGLQNFSLRQCFFGEHLISNDLGKHVAIVESEKTAVIASISFPELTWLATGGKDGLSEEKCRVLRGHNVMLYPDAGCYERWDKKRQSLCHIANFSISSVLETNLSKSEIKEGYDIADYILL